MNIKKDNFKRISESRVRKVVDLISKFHNLINPAYYEFTDEEIDAMFETIQKELDKQYECFIAHRKKGNKKEKL